MDTESNDCVTISEARKLLGTNLPSRQSFHDAMKRGDLLKASDSRDGKIRISWTGIVEYMARGGFRTRRNSTVQAAATDAALADQPVQPPLVPPVAPLIDPAPTPAAAAIIPPGVADTVPDENSFPVAAAGLIDFELLDKGDRQTMNGKPVLYRDATTSGQPAPSESLGALDQADLRYRVEREEIVNSAVKSGIAAGKALYEIHTYRNGLLWKVEYRSFEHYMQMKWGYKKSQGYRLLETGDFVDALVSRDSPNGEKMPLNEGHLRPLFAMVPKEHRVECWDEIMTDKNPAEVTGPMVAAGARKFVLERGLAPKSQKPAKTSDQARAMSVIEKLRSLLGKLPHPERFEQLLLGLTLLIDQNSEADVIEVSATEMKLPEDAPPHA